MANISHNASSGVQHPTSFLVLAQKKKKRDREFLLPTSFHGAAEDVVTFHSRSLRGPAAAQSPSPTEAFLLSFLQRVATQHGKIGSETPTAGDAGRKRPGVGDGPAAPADKRRCPEPRPSSSGSGSRDRHGRRPSSAAEEKVRASHILIKHEGSRRKASWRDPEGVAISATTRDDAADLARALREQVVSGERKFEDVAAENSDCNSAKRGGDLGSFGRGKMQKAFEKATYALKVGEISDVVDTESGVHIIKRTG